MYVASLGLRFVLKHYICASYIVHVVGVRETTAYDLRAYEEDGSERVEKRAIRRLQATCGRLHVLHR